MSDRYISEDSFEDEFIEDTPSGVDNPEQDEVAS